MEEKEAAKERGGASWGNQQGGPARKNKDQESQHNRPLGTEGEEMESQQQSEKPGRILLDFLLCQSWVQDLPIYLILDHLSQKGHSCTQGSCVARTMAGEYLRKKQS